MKLGKMARGDLVKVSVGGPLSVLRYGSYARS